MTDEFAAEVQKCIGPVPCLDRAVVAMRSATTELENKKLPPACGHEETALADLIEARENVRKKLADGKGGKSSKSMKSLDKQLVDKMKKDKDKEKEEDEEAKNDLAEAIDKLAKTEEKLGQEIDPDSSGSQSCQSEQSDGSEQKSSPNGQSPSEQTAGSQSPGGQSPNSQSLSSQSPGSGQSGKSGQGSLAQRQQQAAQKAADLQKQMEDDDALSDLALERMQEALDAIESSAESLEGGNRHEAGQMAKEAAEHLDRLARQVAALKAAELAGKLKAAERMAQELAQKQLEVERDGHDLSKDPSELAKQERKAAEEVRTLKDLLEQTQEDAIEADSELAQTLRELHEMNPPDMIAERIQRAADSLQQKRLEPARSDMAEATRQLQKLAERLNEAHRNLVQPDLEALFAAERQAAELQKVLASATHGSQRAEVEKMMSEMRDTMDGFGKGDKAIANSADGLADALGTGGRRGGWRQSESGYYDPPLPYVDAVGQVVVALQTRIQQVIRSDAVQDRDLPVPPEYKKEVERYYQVLSEDLR